MNGKSYRQIGSSQNSVRSPTGSWSPCWLANQLNPSEPAGTCRSLRGVQVSVRSTRLRDERSLGTRVQVLRIILVHDGEAGYLGQLGASS
ncbi:hypothetical protein WMW72_13435 [Paenibacillus filicis]|uniref:Uncharacterized protein n=1 Tax=Paenibacillus filicis TaxID=669464 RepID=A0ABU9DJ60_9BACL